MGAGRAIAGGEAVKRVAGGWLLTDDEVGSILLNQLGMQLLGEESVLELSTPRELRVLEAVRQWVDGEADSACITAAERARRVVL